MPNSPSTPSARYDAMTDQEKWLPVFRYEGKYEVSSRGRVRSYKRVGRTQGRPKVLRLNLRGSDGGYWYIQLRRNGQSFTHKVARLVADAFLPNTDKLPIVNHKDGIKTNDHVTNLEWCNQGDNLRHAYRTGLKIPVRGEASPHHRLSNGDVRTIRRMIKEQCGIRFTARTYGVSHTTIRRIASRSKWKHVA